MRELSINEVEMISGGFKFDKASLTSEKFLVPALACVVLAMFAYYAAPTFVALAKQNWERW